MADEVLGRTVLEVDADASGYDRTLGRAHDQAKGFTGKVKSEFKNLKANLSTGFKQGLGIGAGLGAVQAVTQAVSGAISYMGDAVHAAREEEAGIAALSAALRNHAEGWDGSTEAIERTIKAQQDQFAFSDGEQREALGRLVAITGGDIPKSMDLMRQSMDLARFRGIDLASAGDIVAKVYGGNIGILSRYGIQVEKGATSTEALAKIQELAAGQAEAYGESSLGAAESAGLAFADLQEDIGKQLLPVLTKLARFTRDVLAPALTTLIPLLSFEETSAKGIPVLGEVESALNGISDAGFTLRDHITRDFDRINEAAQHVGTTYADMRGRIRTVIDEFGGDHELATRFVRDNWETIQSTTETSAEGIVAAVRQARVETGEQSWEMMQGILSNVHEGRIGIEGEADLIAGAIPAATLEHWDTIRQSGTDAVAAYNLGIFEAQGSLSSEIDALLKHLDERMAPGEEISYLRGKKMELAMARGIAEAKGDAGAVAAIDALIAKINAQLAGLNGYSTGKNLVITLANGIRQNLGTASLASAALAGIIRGPVFIESEPKDPNSPLRGITKIGGNIVRTIADDMLRNLGTGYAAARQVAASFRPSLAVPTMVPAMASAGMAPAATGTGGGTTIINQWILQTDGEREVFDSKRAMLDRIEEMSETWQ